MSLGDRPDHSESIWIIYNDLAIGATSYHDANLDRDIEASYLSMLALLSGLIRCLPHLIGERESIKDLQNTCK
jgi:hypothetical protein